MRHRSADVARCWAKYGLNLLQLSHSRLIRLSNDEGEGPPPSVEDGSLTLKSLASKSSVSPGIISKYCKQKHVKNVQLSIFYPNDKMFIG
jgi:hypothetical protein